jgi:hypothetical protein
MFLREILLAATISFNVFEIPASLHAMYIDAANTDDIDLPLTNPLA